MYLILYDQKSSSKTLNQIVSKFQEKYGSKNNLEILTPTTDISDKDKQNPSFTESEKCITKEEIEEFTGITNGGYQKVYAPAPG